MKYADDDKVECKSVFAELYVNYSVYLQIDTPALNSELLCHKSTSIIKL